MYIYKKSNQIKYEHIAFLNFNQFLTYIIHHLSSQLLKTYVMLIINKHTIEMKQIYYVAIQKKNKKKQRNSIIFF